MGRYRKVDVRIWNDRKFQALSDRGKLVFFFLLTHPHLTALGAMRGTVDGLAVELGWKAPVFRRAFQEASDLGMVQYDQEHSIIVLPNFLKYNRPESPNVVKSWESALDLLPECPLGDAVISRAKAYAEGLGKAFAEALPEAFRKALPNQEQEQEQEQKPSPPSPPSRGGSAPDGAGGRAGPDYDRYPGFCLCWKAYPHVKGRSSKCDSLERWKRYQLEPMADNVLAWIRRFKETPDWQREPEGKPCIPAMERWLRKHRDKFTVSMLSA